MNKKFRAWYLPDGDTPDGMLKFIQVEIEDRLYFAMESDPLISYPFDIPFIDEDWVVEQWTGLVDENSIEIFEGDIIKYNNLFLEIRYVDLYGSFMAFSQEGLYQLIALYEHTSYSLKESKFKGIVIGNIHQNKSLLDNNSIS